MFDQPFDQQTDRFDESGHESGHGLRLVTDQDAPSLEGLGERAPGAELAVLLEGIDRDELSGKDKVALLQARARQIAHLQAEFLADAVAVADTDPYPDKAEFVEFAADEIRAALSWTRRAAEGFLGLAHDLVERLPHVWQVLQAGVIDLARAGSSPTGSPASTTTPPGRWPTRCSERLVSTPPGRSPPG